MENTELINAARDGDKGAMRQLLMMYRTMVASVVARSVFEEDNRSDVLQNIFVRAVKAIGTFGGSCKFSTWLYRITINEVADYTRQLMRSKNRFTPYDQDVFMDLNSPDGLESYTNKELSLSINETLSTLPLDQKTAFSLYYFCGYSGRDAAGVLSISEDNFFMKLKAARDKVKKALIAKGWSL
jgi:RNA polymerase sigma-70 factor (ECF subfamily)